jgi:hypothetical protein
MSRYLLRRFPTYRLPPEALVEVKNCTFLEAARWAHKADLHNLIDRNSKIAHFSRSLAPLRPRHRPDFLAEGDELMIMAPHPRGVEPQSLGDFRFTWVRIRELSRASG